VDVFEDAQVAAPATNLWRRTRCHHEFCVLLSRLNHEHHFFVTIRYISSGRDGTTDYRSLESDQRRE